MRPNPAKRLQPVIEQAKKSEQEAAAQLAQCQRELSQQQAQQTALLRYQLGYQQQWQQLGRQGQSAQTLQDFRRFLEQLQSALDAQQKRIEHSQQQVQSAQNHWQQQHSRSEALLKLQSRYQTLAQQQENQREQRLQDEWAQRRQGFSLQDASSPAHPDSVY